MGNVIHHAVDSDMVEYSKTPSLLTQATSRNVVNKNDVELLHALLNYGEGVRYSVLGDSISAGVGHASASAYGEYNDHIQYSGQNLLGLSLMLSDDNFIPPNPAIYTVLPAMSTTYPVLVDSHSFLKSTNPTITYNVTQKGAYKYDKLTIYYIERTTNTAPTFDIVCNGVTTTIDTYVPAVVYDQSLAIVKRVAKKTITVPKGNFSFVIQNAQMLTRTEGTSADGRITILGFALGNGVTLKNYAVGSTTLLNNSAANQSKNITTDGRLQKAYDMNANVISIGWGTNDSKTGVTTVEAFKTDLMKRIDQIRAWKPNTIIILHTAPKGKAGTQYQYNPAYNQVIRETANEKKVNLFDSEFLFDSIPSGAYADDVHPSDIGYLAIGKSLCTMFRVPFLYNNKTTVTTA